MLTSNPFAGLSESVPPIVMQTYVVIMIVLVAGGTLFDVIHKGSAKYFFDNWRNSNKRGTRDVSGGQMAALAIQTIAVDGLTSGEFCSARRRAAHLLTMYGFHTLHVEIWPRPIQAESKFSQIGPSPRKDNPRKRLGFPWIPLSELSLFMTCADPLAQKLSSAPLSRSEAPSCNGICPGARS